MRKKELLLMCVVVAIIGIAWAVNFSPSSIPFPYDPNQIDDFLIGGVWSAVGDFISVDVNCTDIHPFTIVALNPPIGLFVVNSGGNWRIEWTPVAGQEGTHYVVLEATDIPGIPHQPKSSRGTIIIQIEPENLAPVFHPLEDSPIVAYIWPQDYQKRWQELAKQGTIMKGPVATMYLR